MPRFEITFATSIPNAEDPDGYWYNYYTASSRDEAISMFAADVFHMKDNIRWLEVNDPEDVRRQFRHLAWERYEYGDEYPDEIEDIRKRWNKLVPTAQALGISHSEMKDIWNGIGLDASWR